MNPATQAMLAVSAAGDGDVTAAQAHLSAARQRARSTSRRDRQIVQIAALVVAGHRTRAAGLALEHNVQFPDDAGLLARMAPATS